MNAWVQQPLRQATVLTSAASLMALPWSPSVSGKLAAVLALLGWIGWALHRRRRASADAAERAALRLAWVWVLGGAVYLLVHLVRAQGLVDAPRLEAPSRLLAYGGLVFLPFFCGLRMDDLRAPIAVAGLWFGALTLGQTLAEPGQRSFGLYRYENLMGYAAMGQALLLGGLSLPVARAPRLLQLAGLVGSLIAVGLSGTRGAWPGLLTLAVMGVRAWRRSRAPGAVPAAPSRRAWLGMGLAGLLLAIGLAGPLHSRLSTTVQDVVATAQGDRWGSLGMRLVLTEQAVAMIRSRPWTGHGLSAFHEQVVQWADTIGIHAGAMERGFQNPHNQMLHWAQGLGLPTALAAVGLLVVFPLAVAWRPGRGDPEAARALRALSVTVPVFFLSEALLDRHHGAQWFGLVYGLFIGLSLAPVAPPASPAMPPPGS